ncbi:hypothetical protein GUJ93_ZPchr0006g45231 [Zizania palustris]|uniref:Uncharacterized protein n=1 Tax=Zizania palustris TaxID=103762 RepID=A0A8J5W3V3_ZIZPA|nr:hypothetical protein GUJ93_ZPchr0006g45231 [Zizania palustris]
MATARFDAVQSRGKILVAAGDFDRSTVGPAHAFNHHELQSLCIACICSVAVLSWEKRTGDMENNAAARIIIFKEQCCGDAD